MKDGEDNAIHEGLLQRARSQADAGRRLAMYDRQTGLYASWYIERRFDEEAERALRYDLPLSLMVVEVPPSDGYRSQDGVTEWMQSSVRCCDLTCHLGDGRYLVLAPQTSVDALRHMAYRLREHFPTVSTGLSSFPDDGQDLVTLQGAAERRLRVERALAW
jgi:GGDEF domain-containing protein